MTSADQASAQVDLAGGESASTLLHRIVADVAGDFPEVFAEVGIPESARQFKDEYTEVVPRFEAARAASERRHEIATALVESSARAVCWRGEGGEAPLAEHVAMPASPLPLEVRAFGGSGRLRPRVTVGGADLRGAELRSFAHDLVSRGSASVEVAQGVERIVELAGADGIDLSDRRIAVLGAGAELSPVRFWLEGGADVLWIDLSPPPGDLLRDDTLAGTIRWCASGADLLTAPERVRATLAEFANGGAIDLGLYAYAPGRGREWRLTGAMNAIASSLPDELVRTTTMLVSPTTPAERSADDLAGQDRRRRERPRWQAALERVGLLGRGPGHVVSAGAPANRGIVGIQGASYQAAQYLGKLMAAEAWSAADPPRLVSATMAGISKTESLRHPVFDTAFGGAEAFGVETFEPVTTATLNGLLALRDWLDAGQSSSTVRVHGGLYQLPYPVEPTLRVATMLGGLKSPRRLVAMIPRPGR